jgi:hypothetical protein
MMTAIFHKQKIFKHYTLVMMSAITNKIFKHYKLLVVLPILVCIYTLYQNHLLDQANARLEFSITLFESETRILEQEIREKDNCPSYDDGYRDAIIRSCGDWGGDYQAGWRDACKTLDWKNYSDGYHMAIAQFGYQSTNKEIVPKNKHTNDVYDIAPNKNEPLVSKKE